MLNEIDVINISMEESIQIIKYFLKVHDEPAKVNRSYVLNEDLTILV